MLELLKKKSKKRKYNMIKKEVNKIKYIAEEIIDIPFGSIDSKKRHRNISLARQVVGAFIVCELGIDIAKASELMNRDRTSFYFYKRKHQEYMSDFRIYPEYNQLFELVYKRYMNDDESIFKSKDTISWFEQLEKIKQEQKAIDRKMLALERESKLLGL
ncbi:MAG TPA: hypothetical protein DCM10_20100 [Xanthomarina gelatinilytica]|nr:hypothetical protein [Xanthomarina gelatinilytica]